MTSEISPGMLPVAISVPILAISEIETNGAAEGLSSANALWGGKYQCSRENR